MVLEMKSVSCSCGKDVEHNGVGLEEISEIFAIQDGFLFATASLDKVYRNYVILLLLFIY